MSYPDWVPMWLRTAMGRKCEDLAELAVPVTMAVDGQERFTMATFGPIAWRVPDGCGEPKGEVRMTELSRYSHMGSAIVDFIACKHRPNARAVLISQDSVVFADRAMSFDTRCIEAITARLPKARWSRPFLAEHLCAFDGEPAKDIENLVAIVRSHGKHFDVVSKKRAELPGGEIIVAGGRPPRAVDVGALPMLYDVNTLSGVPAMRATWVGPVVRFEFKEARFVPQSGEVFWVGFNPRSRWKAQQQQRDRGDTWIDARLVADGDPKLAEDVEYDPAVVEHVVMLVVDEMAESKRHAAERAKTVSPVERDSLWLKWSAEAGALLANASNELTWHDEEVKTLPGAPATTPGPQAGIFLSADVKAHLKDNSAQFSCTSQVDGSAIMSDGPRTLHVPLSLMEGLATSIYFDEHRIGVRIGVAARLEMPANVSVAFVEIDGLKFRLVADRVSPHDASVTLLDLVPVEGPSLERNNELADRLFKRVNRVSRT